MRQRLARCYRSFRDFHATSQPLVWPPGTVPGSTAVIISRHLLVQSGERRERWATFSPGAGSGVSPREAAVSHRFSLGR